jgi:light-regulated signal transduction histidine kinase (bacteriophytochrome)
LTELSSRATHDLVGPLHRSASLLTLFVRRYRNQLDHEADRLLELLASASTSMEGVAAGVRKYLEIAARGPSYEPVDLNASLASSMARLEKMILASGAVIMPDSLPAVSADADHMVTLFENLIGNSIKFRRRDMSPRIQVSAATTGDRGTITISDNGLGIPTEYRDAVFQPFKRLNGAEYPGAGLGLTMARLIAEMYGGGICIESPGDRESSSHGTCVRFTMRTIQAN